MACRSRLVGLASRREHYRSDWHRVNLKRKVGGLGPLSQEELAIRVAAMRSEEEGKQRKRETKFCGPCSKKFSSEKALENHVKSRRHLERMRVSGDAGSVEVSTIGGSDEEEGEVRAQARAAGVEDDTAVQMELERRLAESRGLEGRECLFDESVHESVEENIKYMAKRYGFFVPYVERLKDVDGLMRYLGQKVGVGYACVECDRAFGAVADARKHMRDKAHCKMTADEEDWMAEYGEFYEFEGDDGWEEVGEEEGAVVDVGGEVVEREEVNAEEVGLAVNGKVLGHRSLRRYYEQSAGGHVDERAAVVANRVMREYRLLGWEGKGRDAVAVKKMRRETRRDQRFQLSVGGQNYYTRKARFKQSMAVFNSGYRA
ncbi:unnamed protein product [Chondrus crispus]|uniref:C2H2-type domain-containing protein n=1 Tax=Chondrus crispus TaxID=2769 RepID=R7QSX5_CHOCR|nr:unnamed protein product [Chondrus crispus]CDF40611.1 unnamed protein product [Chondrus crispus]|eukprot:XP_005710905.1 unnamed protein product [Chondrus crispus]